MTSYRELSAKELAGLKAFALYHGRQWKKILAQEYWPRARVWIDNDGTMHYELHGLRNDLGPEWLSKFKLPKEG